MPWIIKNVFSKNSASIIFSLLLVSVISSCKENIKKSVKSSEKVLYVSSNGGIRTLDPVMTSDLASSRMVANFYDTLMQYDFIERPYKLKPSALETFPEISDDLLSYKFKLRDDLYFQKNQCFSENKKKRKITSKDIVFSLLRLADTRLHSPGYWLIRGKIKGIDEFREITSKADKNDLSVYDIPCKGFEILNEREFIIYMHKPDPRLLYALAMPYTSIVSRVAVEYYKDSFSEHPIGSGPFTLTEWNKNYSIILNKNKEYRTEFFNNAYSKSDRTKKLPYLDKIVCYSVKQPISSWLMFLQGELDISSLNKDNFDVVVTKENTLIAPLKNRGIRMIDSSDFEINYIGFSFSNDLLANNINLRKAISYAYNINTRIKHFNYRIEKANGPIPPGVPGYEKSFQNPFNEFDLSQAKLYLEKAGYKNGIDPKTNKPLELSFDLSGASSSHRQIAEFMVQDMAKIGIIITPFLNSKTRFFQKLRKGQIQLFRLSWIGDYPDAENFLQLFYGPYSKACNRVCYDNKEFNKLFEEIMTMKHSPERTKKYKRMNSFIVNELPWIFESYPKSYRLVHSWLENYKPHNFAFGHWKYWNINNKKKEKKKKAFTPMSIK